MSPLTRREFLAGAASVVVVAAAAACSSDSTSTSAPGTTPETGAGGGLPDPSEAPFDTVVVLMMENRSFDHLLGWLPGANGKQAGLTLPDLQRATPHATYAPRPRHPGLRPTRTRRTTGSRWSTQYNDGKLRRLAADPDDGDLVPDRLLRARRRCPILGGARPELHDVRQLPLLAAGTDLAQPLLPAVRGAPTSTHRASSPARRQAAGRPSSQLAIFDRVHGGRADGRLLHLGRADDGAVRLARSYDSHLLSRRIEFFTDAAAGHAAQRHVHRSRLQHRRRVPRHLERLPPARRRRGRRGLRRRRSTTRSRASPQWERMVFVLNFDETRRLLRPRRAAGGASTTT